MLVLFVETALFTRQIRRLISEESYRQLQQRLAGAPARGDLIRGSGGCRKIRWRSAGKGKRGGIRVIYYWRVECRQIFMLLAYSKTESADLSQLQIKQLGELVKKELGRQ